MNSFSKLKVNKNKIKKKSCIFKASTIRARISGQHRDEGASRIVTSFQKQCGCLTHVDNAKTILRKVSSSFKRLNAYQELVANKLIHVRAKLVCSGCLKQNVISEFETLPDVESQINLSIFSWMFLKYPFPSRLTFKLLFRFKKAFLKYF